MNVYKHKAYAKINLTLEIVGVEEKYHVLDSLVASVALCDEIKIKKRADDYSTVRMQGMGSEHIPTGDNNAVKAALAFSKRFKTCGVDITIKKNIPLGGGLGGSSADAAGVLYAMSKLYEVNDTAALEQLAESLGSDTKYMLTGGYKRMQGRGERLTDTGIDTTLNLLLLCPSTSVSAGACYKKYDELPKTLQWLESATDGCIQALQTGDMQQAIMHIRNDLYVPALQLNQDVGKAMEEMQELHPTALGMTGSGSCVFGIFPSMRAVNAAKKKYNGDFLAIATRTVSP